MAIKTDKYSSSQGVFLDADTVSSSIRWRVAGSVSSRRSGDVAVDASAGAGDSENATWIYAPSLYGEIHISDCERFISWTFTGPDTLKKVDKAIECLKTFRDEYVTIKDTIDVRLDQLKAEGKTVKPTLYPEDLDDLY